MRMTRDAYAREVWKLIETLEKEDDQATCPHENCEQQLDVVMTSVRTGTTVRCPDHGVIFRN